MEAGAVVLRLFGRPLLAEDWRLIGRWSFASAWLAEDETSARELVQTRLSGACSLATSAALAAGRADAERFTLVTALARLAKAFEGGGGPLADAASRMVQEMVARLVDEGAALRSAVARERAVLAPGFDLDGFTRAMNDVGSERHVLFREALGELEEALAAARGDCPALRTLHLFLQATLVQDSSEGSWQAESRSEAEGSPFRLLTLWLTADLALSHGLPLASTAAWSAAARESGDALSRALNAASSGATVARSLVEALPEEPWALPLALAATKPSDAVSLLDFGVQAQKAARGVTTKQEAAWRSQAAAVKGLEDGVGLSIAASSEARRGPQSVEDVCGQDLFIAWSRATLARDGANSLAQAAERSVAAEAERLRIEVRQAQAKVDAVRRRYDAETETLTAHAVSFVPSQGKGQEAENRAQKGCLIGLISGASVVATYVLGGLIVGTGQAFSRLGPFVVAVAALPISAGILSYVVVTTHRASQAARLARQNARSQEELARKKEALRRQFEKAFAAAEEILLSAEGELDAFERRTLEGQKAA